MMMIHLLFLRRLEYFLLQILYVFPSLGTEGQEGLVASCPHCCYYSPGGPGPALAQGGTQGRPGGWLGCSHDAHCDALTPSQSVYRPAAIKLRVSPHLGQFIFVIHHVHIQGKTRHAVSSTTHLIITLPPPPPLCLSVSFVRVSLTRSDSQSAQPRQ